MSITTQNPLNLQTEVIDEPNTNTGTGSNASSASEPINYSLWIIVGFVIVLIVVLIINYFIRSSYKQKQAELLDLNKKYMELTEENESLQTENEQLQSDNKNYVNHINRLADELETRQQPKNPYSPVIPMTENSFDAPDPNAKATKPQIVKDKEQLRAMVNSKRQTVQDVIDQQQEEKANKTTTDDATAQKEIKILTQADVNDDIPESNNDNKTDDEDIEADDKNVNDLMNIIQNQ